MRSVTAREHYAREVAYAGILLCMVGMVTSPALLSIGTVTLILPALVAVPLGEQWRRFWGHKPAFFLSLIFLVQIASGLWTREAEFSVWLEQVRIKAPLFFGMYSLAVLGPYARDRVRIALILLLLAVTFVGTGTMVDYFLNRAAINQRIQVSKEVQVWLGMNHIYFSIVSGFSVLAGVWLAQFKTPLRWRGERGVIIGLTLVVFVTMHVLTTRTGLVGLYLTGGLLGFVYVLRQKKYLLGALAFVVLVSVPFVGYEAIPSFRYRIDNTWMDVSRYFRGKDPNYLSIGTRLESWKTAVNLFKRHPLIGVGMADIKADMTDQYVADETLLCPENFVLPHNQFLRLMAGFGLLGLLPFTYAWFMTPLQRRIPKGWLFWAFWLTYSLAMLGESTVERQVGIMFLITLLWLSLSEGAALTAAKRPD